VDLPLIQRPCDADVVVSTASDVSSPRFQQLPYRRNGHVEGRASPQWQRRRGSAPSPVETASVNQDQRQMAHVVRRLMMLQLQMSANCRVAPKRKPLPNYRLIRTETRQLLSLDFSSTMSVGKEALEYYRSVLNILRML